MDMYIYVYMDTVQMDTVKIHCFPNPIQFLIQSASIKLTTVEKMDSS